MARPKKSTQVEKGIKPSAVLQAGFNTINSEPEESVVNPIPETKTVVLEIINVYAVRYQLWHPFQKRMIPVNDPVPVLKDNWLSAQMKVGHIKEI